MKAKPSLLVFDLDGVLVDSEPVSERIFVQCLQNDGFAVDEAFHKKHFLGRSIPDCLHTMQSHFNRQPGQAVLDEFQRQVALALRAELQPVAFVKEALDQLPQPKCVASGSDLSRIQLSLQVTGLEKYIANITSAFEVDRGKPAPDVFLKAAEKNGFAPGSCIVIEDSVFGVEAGLAAGMTVLCYQPHPDQAYPVPPGVNVFGSMKELPALVEKVVRK